jgi:hypothetical protein
MTRLCIGLEQVQNLADEGIAIVQPTKVEFDAIAIDRFMG